MNIKSINHSAKLSILSLAILSSFGAVQAGSVTSTFATGDTLTATKMTEIRTAVNDNDSKVATNTSSIANVFNGDGSALDLAISASTNWSSTPPANPNFANCTIDAGFTLTVPAGSTIRCSGTFTNNGTLSVSFGATAEGALNGLATSSGPTDSMTSIPHPGDTPGIASLGDSNDVSLKPTQSLGGGKPGKAIPEAVAITSFSNFRIGGGSGAGWDNQGLDGGGLVKIYCGGAIVNAGTITATGRSGANDAIGGGGGGIVILASRTSVDNSAGTIDVSGGNGRAAISSFGGNGGGGGGGIIIMIAPTAPVLGTETVTGGTGGTNTTSVSTNVRTAGGGGGGSGGQGGNGGSLSSTGVRGVAGAGSAGYVISLTNDPLFMAH